MSLINWEVELKLKWTSHCVLATGGVDNNGDPSNAYLYYEEHKTIMSLL